MYISNKRGFTIVELLIVISIIIILLSVVLPQFGKTRDIQILNSTVTDINSAIHKARSQTLASLNSKVYGVRFLSNQVIITVADACSNTGGNYQIYETLDLLNRAFVEDVSILDGGGEYCFNKLTGRTFENKRAEFFVRVRGHGVKMNVNETGTVLSVGCPCDIEDSTACCNNI